MDYLYRLPQLPLNTLHYHLYHLYYLQHYHKKNKLASGEIYPGEIYQALMYVREQDRYANGLSKIELTKIEIISGFDPNQFEWVKTSLTQKFSSLKETKDIEWLESEENIKKLRKEKLQKIIK